jgi:hypothetical protein
MASTQLDATVENEADAVTSMAIAASILRTTGVGW